MPRLPRIGPWLLAGLLALSLPAWALPDAQIHSALDADGGWQLVQKKDGVSVFRKAIPGLGMEAFRGEKTLADGVDPAVLFRLLNDVEAHLSISESLAESKLVRQSGAGMLYYQVMSSPPLLPVAPRYWINEAERREGVGGEAGHRQRRWSSVHPDAQPELRAQILAEYPGALPLAYTYGVWDLDPQPDGSTRVRLTTVSDPGGNMPDALAQSLSGRTLPGTILRFEAAARGR